MKINIILTCRHCFRLRLCKKRKITENSEACPNYMVNFKQSNLTFVKICKLLNKLPKKELDNLLYVITQEKKFRDSCPYKIGDKVWYLDKKNRKLYHITILQLNRDFIRGLSKKGVEFTLHHAAVTLEKPRKNTRKS